MEIHLKPAAVLFLFVQLTLIHSSMGDTKRQLVPGGTIWSEKFSYSRAIRVGNVVEVAGTVSVDENGQVVGPGDLYAQTKHALKKIEGALAEVGATMKDVVRTRIYVVDGAGPLEESGKAHGEVFVGINPVNTSVYISRLVTPEFLVEVEVSAIVSGCTNTK